MINEEDKKRLRFFMDNITQHPKFYSGRGVLSVGEHGRYNRDDNYISGYYHFLDSVAFITSPKPDRPHAERDTTLTITVPEGKLMEVRERQFLEAIAI